VSRLANFSLPSRLCLVVSLLLMASGCGPALKGGGDWAEPVVEKVWPSPPDPPRIQLLRVVEPADFVKQTTSASRFFQMLTGEVPHVFPLVAPYGVTADGRGRIWVADPALQAVHAFDLVKHRVDYINVAGGEPLMSPVGVAWDLKNSRLYLSDSVLKKVFVFDADRQLLGTREPEAGFRRPAGLAVDGSGNLFALDVVNGSIEVFSAAGRHLKSLSIPVAEGQSPFSPTNIFVGSDDRLYVTDSLNFRVLILDSDGRVASEIGRLGDVPGSFARPRGVAVDSEGHVYVADAAFDNIQIFDDVGRLLLYIGEPGKEPGQFSLPSGLFFDNFDRLYAVDSYNNRLQLFQYLRGASQSGH